MRATSVDNDQLFSVVYTELKKFGLKLPKVKKLKSSISKQERSSNEGCKKMFGAGLSEQEWISEEGCIIPKFLAITTAYLKKYFTNEGLFRIPGSSIRKEELKLRFENNESIDGAEPNDVASLMKMWLRELPEPIFPSYLQDIFLRCQLINPEEKRVKATMMSCLLLPYEQLCTLKHLLHFLSEFASHSDANKMDAHNIALIMAPNLLSVSCERADKASSSLLHHTGLVELLIKNAHEVGLVPSSVAIQLQGEKTSAECDDIDSSFDILDCSPSVSKKKRRSGPVHELVNGIRRLVGQSLTPVCPGRDQQALERPPSNKTPAKRSAWKRKADRELHHLHAKKRSVADAQSQEMSIRTADCTPVEKTAAGLNLLATPYKEVNHPSTPTSHSSKPFGLLSRKRRNRLKSVCLSNMAKISRSPENENKSPLHCCGNVSKNKEPENCTKSNCSGEAEINMHHLSVPKDTSQHIMEQCGDFNDELSQQVDVKDIQRKPAREKNSFVKKRTSSQEVIAIEHELHMNYCPNTVGANSPFNRPKEMDNSLHNISNTRASRNQGAVHKVDSFSKSISDISKKSSFTKKYIDFDHNDTSNASNSVIHKNDITESDSRLISLPNDGNLRTPKRKNTKDQFTDITARLNAQETRNFKKQNVSSKRSLRRGRPNTINTGLPSELYPKNGSEEETDFSKNCENNKNVEVRAVVKKSNSCNELKRTEGVVNVKRSSGVTEYISIEKFLSDLSPTIFSSQFDFSDLFSDECNKSLSTLKIENNAPLSVCDEPVSLCSFNKEASLSVYEKPASLCVSSKEASSPRNKSRVKSESSSHIPITLANCDADSNHDNNCPISQSHKLAETYSNCDLKPKNKNRNHSRSKVATSNTLLVPSPVTQKDDQITTAPNSSEVQTVHPGLIFCDEEWASAENGLQPNAFDDISSTKRESIVQLMIKNAGKVQANVHHFNHISGLRTTSTPTCSSKEMVQCNSSTKRSMSVKNIHLNASSPILRSGLRNGIPTAQTKQTFQTPNTHGSVELKYMKSKSKKFRNSPIPLPPKFIVTSVDNLSPTSYPLKELINLSNTKDKTPNKSPKVHYNHSPTDNEKGSLKVKKSVKQKKLKPSPEALVQNGTFVIESSKN